MAYNTEHLLRVGDAKTIYDSLKSTDDELKSATEESIAQVVGVNIFDATAVETGKKINTSGQIATASGFYVSKPYPVFPNATYKIAVAIAE